jgi:DNA-binding NtrC family response regulator
MSDEDLLTAADGSLSNEGDTPLFVLRVTQGAGAGQSLLLDWAKQSSFLLGQSTLCDLRLADRRVSRRHASVTAHAGLLRLTDLESTNGTRVAGLRVERALLGGGEVIELGDTQVRVARAPTNVVVPPSSRRGLGRLVGASYEMQRLYDRIEGLAGSPLHVVIEGETGAGKDLVAETLHDLGPHASGPLVFFDCAGAAREGELALAGAVERAKGGTLVLSELADLDPALQAALLAKIDRGPRVLSTTRRDVDREVQDGRLREDLAFRLAGARVEVPPLRRRHGDLPILAAHFWSASGGVGELPRAFAIKLVRGAWPGNVRELEAAVARAVALGVDDADGVAPALRAPTAPSAAPAAREDVVTRALEAGLPLPASRAMVVEELERRFVERALAAHGGNVTRAAAASGLTRRYFHILMNSVRAPKIGGS